MRYHRMNPRMCSIVGATMTVHQFFWILLFVTLVPFAVWSWWYSSPWGVRLKCFYAFSLLYCGCDTSYIVSVHIQCQASIYTLSLCRGHSWRVWLANEKTLKPPGHLVSPLVWKGPWMSTEVLYCWCHSDSASVPLYYTSIFLSLSAFNDHGPDLSA